MAEPRAYVLGLDLSLSRTAAILLPVDFRGDFAEVVTAVAGHGLHTTADELARDARCLEVAQTVEELVHGVRVAGAFVEGYAFARSGAPHALGELRAVVRRVLVARYGWAPVPVSQSAARKLFFGRAPRAPEGGGRRWLKNYILASVRACGAPFQHDDEADAFLIANFGLTEVGGVALTCAPLEPAAPASAPRLRAARRTRRSAA